MGAESSALVSRSRAMPAGGRRSKPSLRFFTIGGTQFRGPPGLGAGVNTGGPLPERHRGWGAIRSGSGLRLRPPPAGEAVSAY